MPQYQPWEIAYADMAVHAALDIIGRRITRTLPRSARHAQSRMRQTHTWQRHTLVSITPDDAQHLVSGAFAFLDATLPSQGTCLRGAVEHHVRSVVTTSTPHDTQALVDTLHKDGCLDTA